MWNRNSNISIATAVAELACRPRQQFGFDICVKNGAQQCMHLKPGLFVIRGGMYDAQAVLEGLEALDMRVQSVEVRKVTLCSGCAKREAFAHAVDVLVREKERAWCVEEFAEYQAHRVEMGLLPLRAGEKRSCWDEEMRLKYREAFGATAYVEKRARWLQQKKEAYASFRHAAEREQEEIEDALCAQLDSMGPVSELVIRDVPFCHVHDAVMAVLVVCANGDGHTTVSDATSGLTWEMNLEWKTFSRVPLPTPVKCVWQHCVPREATCRAARQLDACHGEQAASLLLSEDDVEEATRRFYSGNTFLQYTMLHSSTDASAMHAAFNSDVDGESGDRRVFFALAQVIHSVMLEYEQTEGGEASRDVCLFLMDLWNTTFVEHSSAYYDATYRFKGMLVTEFVDAMTILFDSISRGQ
jgi:hypothetical protein